MIVVDTNILVYASLGATDPSLARSAKALRAKDAQWLLPPIWKHEFTNVLCTMVRARYLDVVSAENALLRALGNYAACEAPLDLARALELAAETGLSGYDAQFLALAEHANCILVTEDKRLIKASRGAAMSLEKFTA